MTPGTPRAGARYRGRRAGRGLIGNIREASGSEMRRPRSSQAPEEGVEGMGEIIYQVTRFHRGFQGPGQTSLDRTLEILERQAQEDRWAVRRSGTNPRRASS